MTHADAADTFKDHVYTALVDCDQVPVWRCANPSTSVYAFDIMNGIAVVGNIANLTLNVSHH